MSCAACDKAQKPDTSNELSGLKLATWVRIGNGNVLISGCTKHLTELIKKLRKASE